MDQEANQDATIVEMRVVLIAKPIAKNRIAGHIVNRIAKNRIVGHTVNPIAEIPIATINMWYGV